MPTARSSRVQSRFLVRRALAAALLCLAGAAPASAQSAPEVVAFLAPPRLSTTGPDAGLDHASRAPGQAPERVALMPPPETLRAVGPGPDGAAPEKPLEPAAAASAIAPLRSAPSGAPDAPHSDPAPRLELRPPQKPTLRTAPLARLSPPRTGRSERLAIDAFRLRMTQPLAIGLLAPSSGAPLDRDGDPERSSAPSRTSPLALGRPKGAPARAARIDGPTGGRWRLALDPVGGIGGALVRTESLEPDLLGLFCAPRHAAPASFEAARFTHRKAAFSCPAPAAFDGRLSLRIGARFFLRRDEAAFRDDPRPYRLSVTIEGANGRRTVFPPLVGRAVQSDRVFAAEIDADAPLIEALKRGRSVTVIEERSGAGRRFPLVGSRRAIERALRFCSGDGL